MISRIGLLLLLVSGVFNACLCQQSYGQAFGVELHATMNPAAGGMGGVSIAKPQDVQSAFTGNPATLTQFQGTQFAFGGGWVEPTINIDNDATLTLAGISPFQAKSNQPGNILGNIAITQDFSAFDLPMTWGVAFLSGVGLGVKYIDVPESNGSAASLLGLHTASGVGVQLTERLSLGAQMVVTTAVLDGPFSGLSAATTAYGLRGLFGANFAATEHTNLGFYWMTKESFRFEDAVRLNLGGGSFSTVQNIQLDLPTTFGLGFSNDRLMDGRLLLASDILYKRWTDCDFFGAIWTDQLVVQTGLQYELTKKIRLRAGYAYAENIMRDDPASGIGGVVPPDSNVFDAIRYIQALFPAINEHRLSAGVGVRDFFPGVDIDVNAGGMFFAEDQFVLTGANAETYWVSLGLTWRFGRGASERLPVPNSWNSRSDVGVF